MALIIKHKTMKLRFLLIICTLLPLIGNAQDNSRQWRKGPLTWNDFKAPAPDSTGKEHSYLEFQLYIDEVAVDNDGVVHWMESALATMDRQKSWVDSLHRTPEELRYNQVIFNIVELYRRYMQTEIDSGGSPDMDYYMELVVGDVDQFCQATNYGSDIAVVEEWEIFIRELMDSAAAQVAESHATYYNEVTSPKNFVTTQRFGIGVGGGMQVVTGDLHPYFRNGGGFYLEANWGQRRQIITISMYMGASKCLRDVYHKTTTDYLLQRDDLTVMDLKFDYGFAVIDGYKFQLTPFVGIGILGYYTEVLIDGSYESTFIGPAAFNWRAGLDFRYHISTNASHRGQYCDLSQITLFTKIYTGTVRFGNYIGEPHGMTFNALLGIAFETRNGVTVTH